jgi:Domain of unknown function (DUF397)
MAKPDFTNAQWRKSNKSGDSGCVEVAHDNGWIGVRDTKDEGTGPILAFNETEWRAFVDGTRSGEFDYETLTD